MDAVLEAEHVGRIRTGQNAATGADPARNSQQTLPETRVSNLPVYASTAEEGSVEVTRP